MRRVLGGFALVLTLIGTASAERLPIKAYTTADGLAHERVTCIVVRFPRIPLVLHCTRLESLRRAEILHLRRSRGPRRTLGSTTSWKPRVGVYWVATNGGGVQRITPVHPMAASRGVRAVGQVDDSTTVLGSRHSPSAMTHKPTASTCCMKTAADGCGPGPTADCFLSTKRPTRRCFGRVQLDVPSRPDRAVQIWAIVEDREGGSLDWHVVGTGAAFRLTGA